MSMADLTQYLPGKTIKAVVGESYNPQPIGQAPTATLPAGKTLGEHKAGEVITAEPAVDSGAALPDGPPTGTSTPEDSASAPESAPEPSASAGFQTDG